MRFSTQSRFYILTILLLVVALVPNVATPAAQASAGYAYKWVLHFDYEGTFDGQLMIDVGRDAGNGTVVQPPLHSETRSVRCKPTGAVNLVGGAAEFNGGYLECDFALADALNAAFAACSLIDPACGMPIGAVEEYTGVKLGASLSAPTPGPAPILTHNSVALAVDVGSRTHALRTHFAPMGNVDSVQQLAMPPAFYTHSARFTCPGGDCGVHFNVAGNPQYVNTVDLPVEFQTAPTTVYIGRDLVGGILAPGSKLDSVFVDPGNGLPD